MVEMFQYSFMQNAFIVGFCVSLLAPIFGVFLIIRRYTMISETLSHISLTGVILGLVSGFSPIGVTLVYTVLSSLVVERIRLTQRVSGDVLLSLLLSLNLALVALLLSLNPSVSFNLSGYLFGSIALVSRDTVYLMVGLFFVMVVVLLGLKNALLKVTFDQDNARAKGILVDRVHLVFIVMVAMLITLALPITGILLLSSLIVLPVMASVQIAWSFRSTVWIAEAISFLSVFLGIIVSYYFDISASGSITLLLVGVFGVMFLMGSLKKK